MKRRSVGVALAAAVGLSASACGSQEEAPVAPRGPSSASLRTELAAATKVTPGDFPATGGRTLQQVANALGNAGPQMAFATSVVQTGERQRVAFGIIDETRAFVYAPTVLYVAKKGGGKALGPFAAPADLLITDSPFRSQTAASEKDIFAAIYDARVDFDEPGSYEVLAASRIDGKLVGSGSTLKVQRPASVAIPDVGDAAPVVSTDSRVKAGGDIKSIDTRLPPDAQHETDFADVVGKKPVALLFATPQLCESRVCGPVVDIAEQLRRTYGDRVTFIHQEVYVDNRIEKGLRPPLQAFRLQTEPWLFTFDARGRVAARLEGSFGFAAFENALKTALR